jgi:hypothetical protein
MNGNNTPENKSRRLQNGYQPKDYITKEIEGRTVQIPISQLNIIPPTAGTGAVTPKQK